jgi:hypothetical protein
MEEQKTRTYLDAVLTEDELTQLQIFEQKLGLAQSTLNNAQVPDDSNSQQLVNVYQAALNMLSETQVYRKKFFDKINKKYTLPVNTGIDLATGQMYTEE